MKRVRVGDVAEQIRGVTFSRMDSTKEPLPGHVPVLTASNITETGLRLSPLQYVPAGMVRGTQKLKEGDILVTASSGSLDVVGRAVFVDRDLDAAFGAFCKVLRFSDEVEPRYAAHYFRTAEYRSTVSRLAAGANINNLKNKDLDGIKLPLPPLPEQRRIASILDRADSIRAMRQESLKMLEEIPDLLFERSVDEARDWGPLVRLGDVFEVKGGKRLPNGAPYASSPTAHPYLRVADMKSGSFVIGGLKYLTSDVQSKVSRYVVKSGDLVISIAGTIGAVAVVPVALDGANLTENAARLRARVGAVVDPHFVRAQLASRLVQDQISRATGRVTIGKLALFRIEELMIRLPPVHIQSEVTRRLEQINMQRGRLAQHLNASIEICETLKTQAFKGEL